MRRSIVLTLAACSHPASHDRNTPVAAPTPDAAYVVVEPPPPTAAPLPVLPWLPKADLVYALETGELVGIALADKPTEVGRTRIAPAEAAASWGSPQFFDRDHVIVQLEDREFALLGVTASEHLVIPPKAKFEAIPMPAHADDPNVPDRNNDGWIAVDKGEIRWKQCVWGYPYDGFQCIAMAGARLWPADPKLEVGDIPIENFEDVIDYGWKDLEKPGFVVTAAKDGRPTCKPAKGKAIVMAHAESPDLRLFAVHYLDGGTLVMYGGEGLDGDVASGFAVYPSCGAKPTITGARYHLFPNRVWIASDDNESGDRIYRDATLVHQLPDNHGYAMKP